MADADPRDRETVQACLTGRTEAWRLLLERHGEALAREIHWVLVRGRGAPDPSVVQDLVQETLLRLLADDCAGLREFRWESSLRTYLKVFAVHTAQKALRKGDAAGPKPGPALPEDRLADDAGLPAGPEVSERDRRIGDAVDRLLPRERLALRMIYWESLPFEAVSRVLRLDRNALSALLYRARRRLRDLLRASFLMTL